MKNLNFTLILVVALTLFMSCDKEDTFVDPGSHSCVFEQNDEDMDGLIDATERSIMDQCSENAFTSKSEIEDNLIGEWELIGHGEGWIPTKSQPCAYVTITADELTFEYESAGTDTTTMHSWEIEEVNGSGGTFFRLNTFPEYVEGLLITQFCLTYMYGNAMPSDGNMYLYQKVK